MFAAANPSIFKTGLGAPTGVFSKNYRGIFQELQGFIVKIPLFAGANVEEL
jgi:hypothetical protein